ncbi:MAG: hypothetical protein PHR06_14850, partial [Candidatus Cloacimonetes bacterium]|nr:hypothetical protein [Candidatus Cloacimonadota bacterium]
SNFTDNGSLGCAGAVSIEFAIFTEIINCTFSSNSSVYSGALEIFGCDESSMIGCTFTGNSSDAIGGAVAIYWTQDINENETSGATIDDCTFTGNISTVGGALYIEFTETIATNCYFEFNSANAQIYIEEETYIWGGKGGAIYSYGAFIELSSGNFFNNSANSIYYEVEDRQVSGHGGAIYADNSELIISLTEFSANQADSLGGVLSSSNTMISRNKTVDERRKMAIYNEKTNRRIETKNAEARSLQSNKTTRELRDDTSYELSGCRFEGNSALYGGVVGLDGVGILNVHTSFFSDNEADKGAAVYLNYIGEYLSENNYSNIYSSLFHHNTANEEGIIYTQNYSSWIENCTVADNDGTAVVAYLKQFAETANLYTVFDSSILWNNLLDNVPSNIILNYDPGCSCEYDAYFFYNFIEDQENSIQLLENESNFSVISYDSFDIDPLFVGSGDHPYQLSAWSKCINEMNTGLREDNTNQMFRWDSSIDLIGNPRINGESIDVGAYEHQGICGVVGELRDAVFTAGEYAVTDNILVPEEVLMEIQAGATFIYHGQYIIGAVGNITATGTEAQPIIFTSAWSDYYVPVEENNIDYYLGESETTPDNFETIDIYKERAGCGISFAQIDIQNGFRDLRNVSGNFQHSNFEYMLSFLSGEGIEIPYGQISYNFSSQAALCSSTDFISQESSENLLNLDNCKFSNNLGFSGAVLTSNGEINIINSGFYGNFGVECVLGIGNSLIYNETENLLSKGTLIDNCEFSQNSSLFASTILIFMSLYDITNNTFSENSIMSGGDTRFSYESLLDKSSSKFPDLFNGKVRNSRQPQGSVILAYGNLLVLNSFLGESLQLESPEELFYVYPEIVSTIEGNEIYNNTSKSGTILSYYELQKINSNNIHNNSADFGGAAACEMSITLLTNNLFYRNQAIFGQAVFALEQLYLNSLNNTITENSMAGFRHTSREYNRSGTAVDILSCTDFNMENSILWNNDGDFQLYIDDDSEANNRADFAIGYCTITNGEQGVDYVSGLRTITFNNIDDFDPEFYDPDNDLFTLSLSSPCINRGNPDTDLNLIGSTDLSGGERFNEIIDHGCFEIQEHQLAPILWNNLEGNLTDINEDETDPAGDTIADFLYYDGNEYLNIVYDADGDTCGIAVIGINNDNGTWQ